MRLKRARFYACPLIFVWQPAEPFVSNEKTTLTSQGNTAPKNQPKSLSILKYLSKHQSQRGPSQESKTKTVIPNILIPFHVTKVPVEKEQLICRSDAYKHHVHF
jgi:hypothetical protein